MARAIELEVADLATTAAALAPGKVRDLTPVRGGGNNNRIFLVEVADGERYALKTYDTGSDDGAERVSAEFRALSFIWAHGLRAVPRPLAIDVARRSALFGWIDGRAVTAPAAADLDAALSFLGALGRLTTSSSAATLPEAKEACPPAAEVVAQIERRLVMLHSVAADHDELGRFLEQEFVVVCRRTTALARECYQRAGLDFHAPIARGQQTLSPSDFGFHNVLKRQDGSLVFVDFEYFGWDDPAKLVSDFLLHPGMNLDQALKRRFLVGVHELFAGDAEFATRLRLLYPLFGLRWCLILLNEFLPERWRRRLFAGAGDRASALTLQLSKARGMLRQLTESGGGFPHDA